MILLLLGTNPYSFHRLLNAVNEWANKNNQLVVAQTGHTPINKVSIECHDFVDYSQVVGWIKQADFVICQGGFGSIKDCIKYNKKIIAVPRIQEYGECMDSQKELVDALSEEGRVLPLFDVNNLSEAIETLTNFTPPEGAASKIPRLVSNVVNELMVG